MELIFRKPKKSHKDLVGKTFGRLTVESLIGYSFKRKGDKNVHEPIYLLKCKCGTILQLPRVEFKYGNTKSCGCLRREIVYERFSKNRTVSDYAFYKTQLLNKYVHKAHSRGHEFALTLEQFDKLTNLPCHYCGAEPFTEYRYKKKDVELLYNGLDRVDNTKGYYPSNVVPCCKVCNFIKGSMEQSEFIEQVNRIQTHCALTQQCVVENWAKSVEAETVNTEVN